MPPSSSNCGASARRRAPDCLVSLARRLVAVPVLVLILGTSPARAADRCGDADLSTLASRIYVATSGHDSASCGNTAAGACQSIQQGIGRCSDLRCAVLVRHGLYALAQTIQIKDGVNVYGRCVFDGDADSRERSVLQAPPGGTPAINAAGIRSATLLDGFFVRGSDATSPGAASIAMTVTDSAALTLRWMQVVSGKGGDGAPGVSADGAQGGSGQSPIGDVGGEGGDACGGGLAGKGGKGADIQQVSSSGCFVTCKCSNNNWPNSAGKPGQDSGTVKGGGGGGTAPAGCACDGRGGDNAGDGPVGTPGNSGACGDPGGTPNANIWGGFEGVKWVPARGGQGSPGAVGSGGGGGGSGGYAANLDMSGAPWDWKAVDEHGRPGGGGGGGGCGGAGGTGGQQGGASIPIVVVNASVNMIGDQYRNVFVPGPGGRGGNGGRGGMGGPGGPGVAGASGHYRSFSSAGVCNGTVPGNGGQGGQGGQGGAGAGGAGGNGGPSVGIALVGRSPAPSGSTGVYEGQPGAGGPTKDSGGQNAPQPNRPVPCKGTDGTPGATGGTSGWQKY